MPSKDNKKKLKIKLTKRQLEALRIIDDQGVTSPGGLARTLWDEDTTGHHRRAMDLINRLRRSGLVRETDTKGVFELTATGKEAITLETELHGVSNDGLLFNGMLEGWQITCMCGWVTSAHVTVGDAGEDFDQHLEEVRPQRDDEETP